MDVMYRLIGVTFAGSILFVVYMFTLDRAKGTSSSWISFVCKGFVTIGVFSLLFMLAFGMIADWQIIFLTTAVLLSIPFVVGTYQGYTSRKSKRR